MHVCWAAAPACKWPRNWSFWPVSCITLQLPRGDVGILLQMRKKHQHKPAHLKFPPQLSIFIWKSQNVLTNILTLVSYLRDKQFDRLTTLHKGKLSSKVTAIEKRRSAGTPLAVSCTVLKSGQWASVSIDMLEYIITKNELHKCSNSCALFADSVIHAYDSCSLHEYNHTTIHACC